MLHSLNMKYGLRKRQQRHIYSYSEVKEELFAKIMFVYCAF